MTTVAQDRSAGLVAMAWIEAAVAGNAAVARALFAPECPILIVGDMPYAGWMDVDGFFAQAGLLKLDSPIVFEIGEMLVDGDRAWVEAQSEGRLQNGAPYRNYYMFQFRVADGKIVEYKEFADTLHIYRLLDAPEVRGPALPRGSILRTVRKTLVGSAVSGRD